MRITRINTIQQQNSCGINCKKRSYSTKQPIFTNKNILPPASLGTLINEYEKKGKICEVTLNIFEHKKIGFEKVAGMKDLKQALYDDVIAPLLHPDKYNKYGLEPINGCLLYGPPGCGKTFIANMLAEETGRKFIEITPSNVGSKYQHVTAQNIASKFNQAREYNKSIVFIDEAEAILPSRNIISENNIDCIEQIDEVLQQINNARKNNIFIILASNEPQMIDSAIKRAGRIDKKFYVSPPDLEARTELFKIKLENMYASKDIDLKKLAEKTDNYIAEDIRIVLHNAGLKAMREDSIINEAHILKAIEETNPSLNSNIIGKYKLKGEM